MQAAWDSIDRIYCISLENRTDRQAQAREQFAKVGLTSEVRFVLVKRHATDIEQGIYESHLLCMQKGLQAGADRILIFEDDVVFDRITSEHLAHGITFLNTHPHWHILFLGCMVRRSKPTHYPSILHVEYRSLTHGYVIHRRLATHIVQQAWHNVPFDDFLRDLKDKQFYALYPSIAFQSNSPSDNERYLPLDRFRRMCGGLKKIQRRNEVYHRHRWVVIAAHLMVLILVILWIGL